jgi:hypothetical protein
MELNHHLDAFRLVNIVMVLNGVILPSHCWHSRSFSKFKFFFFTAGYSCVPQVGERQQLISFAKVSTYLASIRAHLIVFKSNCFGISSILCVSFILFGAIIRFYYALSIVIVAVLTHFVFNSLFVLYL